MRPGTILRWHALKNILKFNIQEDMVILDVGGYDGFISQKLKEAIPGLNTIVVDVDVRGLLSAKEKGLPVALASALKLPIKNCSVDSVLCLDLMEHINEDDMILQEASRVLKSGGRIILTTPFDEGVTFPFMSKERSDAVNFAWGHVRKGYSLSQLSRLFQNNNLEIEKTDGYFNFLSRLIYRLVFLFHKSFPGRYFIFQSVVRLEPYLKYGKKQHIIIGRKLENYP